MSIENKKRIVIADASISYRAALRMILENNYEVYEAANEKQLFDVLITNPALVVYDLYFGSGRFETVMDQMLKISPLSNVLVLSFDNGYHMSEFCLSNGAKGYFDKGITNIDSLVKGIERVSNGKTAVMLGR